MSECARVHEIVCAYVLARLCRLCPWMSMRPETVELKHSSRVCDATSQVITVCPRAYTVCMCMCVRACQCLPMSVRTEEEGGVCVCGGGGGGGGAGSIRYLISKTHIVVCVHPLLHRLEITVPVGWALNTNN